MGPSGRADFWTTEQENKPASREEVQGSNELVCVGDYDSIWLGQVFKNASAHVLLPCTTLSFASKGIRCLCEFSTGH